MSLTGHWYTSGTTETENLSLLLLRKSSSWCGSDTTVLRFVEQCICSATLYQMVSQSKIRMSTQFPLDRRYAVSLLWSQAWMAFRRPYWLLFNIFSWSICAMMLLWMIGSGNLQVMGVKDTELRTLFLSLFFRRLEQFMHLSRLMDLGLYQVTSHLCTYYSQFVHYCFRIKVGMKSDPVALNGFSPLRGLQTCFQWTLMCGISGQWFQSLKGLTDPLPVNFNVRHFWAWTRILNKQC